MKPEAPLYISFVQFISVSPITPGITSFMIVMSMFFESGVYLISVDTRIMTGKTDMNKKNADWAEYAARLSLENFAVI